MRLLSRSSLLTVAVMLACAGSLATAAPPDDPAPTMAAPAVMASAPDTSTLAYPSHAIVLPSEVIDSVGAVLAMPADSLAVMVTPKPVPVGAMAYRQSLRFADAPRVMRDRPPAYESTLGHDRT